MSTSTEIHPLVAQAKQETEDCRAYLLNTFSFVPEGKLTWSPAETCKNAIQIVAHCAVCNDMFAERIKRVPWPDVPLSEFLANRGRLEAEITTREAAIQALEDSCAKVQAALDAMSQDDVDSVVETPAFSRPMTFFMFLPAKHMDGHACQIDFLQTCWGDMVVHF